MAKHNFCMSVTHQRGSASRGGLRMWQIGKAGPVGQVIQVGQARQEALSMLRLILLIIYIYSCRHECDFEKSQKKKTGCHYLMEKSLMWLLLCSFAAVVALAGGHLLILSLPFRPFGGCSFCRLCCFYSFCCFCLSI